MKRDLFAALVARAKKREPAVRARVGTRFGAGRSPLEEWPEAIESAARTDLSERRSLPPAPEEGDA